MPDKFGWPTLPAGARWVDAEEAAGKTPPEQVPSPKDIQSNVGSVLRQVMGPPKPEQPPPSFLQDLAWPVAAKATRMAVDTVNPVKDPVGFGLMLASTLLPGGPAVRAMGKIGTEIAPVAETMGMSGLRRVLSMAGVGAAGAGMAGQNPASGAFQGLVTQLGGEGARKLTQFAGMSGQAKKMAAEDPARLGQIVSQIIPNLGSMRSPRDFFAAFKKTGAQQAISQAYGQARAGLSQEIGEQVFQSPSMQALRGNPAMAGAGQIPPGMAGQPAKNLAGGAFSFDDVMETLKRLRTQGYTEDEAKAGLNAMLARDRASAIEKEFLPQLKPDQAAKVSDINTNYARGQRVIDLLDDPKLLKQGKEELNIPAIQQKYLSMGYNVGQSYALAADAADLEAALFRGGQLGADQPGSPGKLFGNLRFHLGFLPTFHPELPTPGTFAGRDLPGLSPFGGSAVGQLLRKGVGTRSSANTLRAPDEE